MTEIVETNLATKEDIKDVRQEIKQDIKNLENKITQSEYPSDD